MINMVIETTGTVGPNEQPVEKSPVLDAEIVKEVVKDARTIENNNTTTTILVADESTIHKKTMRRLQQWEAGSRLLSATTKIPHLKTNDLVVGQELAQGCFGAVYAVTYIRCVEGALAKQLVLKRARCFLQTVNTSNTDTDSKDEQQQQQHQKQQQKKQNISFFDLACEAQFLCTCPPGTFEYGLVFDKLALTLAQLVDDKWRAEYPSCIGGRRLRWWNNNAKTRAFYQQRVQVITQLASALGHLHQHSVVYRDMKPPNVGFRATKSGSTDYEHLELFDFGCAKELKVKHLVEQPDGYRATPMTGTIGYMSPEVMLDQPYGLSADVFSFAMMMWYIFSLQKPIDHNQTCSTTAVEDMLYRHKRPRALPILSERLQQLMEQCWARDRLQRPKFAEIIPILQAECEQELTVVEKGQ